MGNKLFSERINKELDEIGVPQRSDERIGAFAILSKQPAYKAEAILNGHIPDASILTQIAEELEVGVDWLLGKSDKRRS